MRKLIVVLAMALMVSVSWAGMTTSTHDARRDVFLRADSNIVYYDENGDLRTWDANASGGGSSGDLNSVNDGNWPYYNAATGKLGNGASKAHTYTTTGEAGTTGLSVPPEWPNLDGNLVTGYGGGKHMMAAGPNQIAAAGGALVSDTNSRSDIAYTVVGGNVFNPWGARADYICTGTEDETNIQAAIDRAYSFKGGTIFLAGDFNISGPNSLHMRDGVSLKGAGVSLNLSSNCPDLGFTPQNGTVIRGAYSLCAIHRYQPAINKGSGLVGLPIWGHTFVAGNNICVSGTKHYNGYYAVQSVSTDEVNVIATYVAETFTGNEIAVRPQTIIKVINTTTHMGISNCWIENLAIMNCTTAIESGDKNELGFGFGGISDVFFANIYDIALNLRNDQHINVSKVNGYNVHRGGLYHASWNNTCEPSCSIFQDMHFYMAYGGRPEFGYKFDANSSGLTGAASLNAILGSKLQVNCYDDNTLTPYDVPDSAGFIITSTNEQVNGAAEFLISLTDIAVDGTWGNGIILNNAVNNYIRDWCLPTYCIHGVDIRGNSQGNVIENIGTRSADVNVPTLYYNKINGYYTPVTIGNGTTITTEDNFLICSNTTATSYSLPTAVGYAGKELTFKRITPASVGLINIYPKLVGTLYVPTASVTLRYDGSLNWLYASNDDITAAGLSTVTGTYNNYLMAIKATVANGLLSPYTDPNIVTGTYGAFYEIYPEIGWPFDAGRIYVTEQLYSTATNLAHTDVTIKIFERLESAGRCPWVLTNRGDEVTFKSDGKTGWYVKNFISYTTDK